MTKFGNDAGSVALLPLPPVVDADVDVIVGDGDFNDVPLSDDVIAGTELARRLELLDDRKVDLALFFFNFLSLGGAGSDFSGKFPFLFSSLASER